MAVIRKAGFALVSDVLASLDYIAELASAFLPHSLQSNNIL
jgi:hypothetical protein